jgi:hypothetical protein
MLVLLVGINYQVHRLDGLKWYDLHTKFTKIGTDVGLLRLCLSNLKGCNVGINDERDLRSAPLK